MLNGRRVDNNLVGGLIRRHAMPKMILDFNDSTNHEQDFMAEWVQEKLIDNGINPVSFAYNIHVEYEEDNDAELV